MVIEGKKHGMENRKRKVHIDSTSENKSALLVLLSKKMTIKTKGFVQFLKSFKN